tara:strand:- start:13 stop:207 length:195 start_codon:yes stop_codon:yes gene_type:complete
MSTKESKTPQLSYDEINMWNEIYLKYLYRYIEDGEWKGCQAYQASGDADSAMGFILAKNKSMTL